MRLDNKKVCLVTLDNPVHHLRDGIAVAVEGLARGLARERVEVHVAGQSRLCTQPELITRDGIHYWCLPSRGGDVMTRMLYFMSKAPRLLERLGAEGVTVFHGQGGYAGAIAAARLPGACKIATLHTTHEEDRATVSDLWQQGSYLSALRRWGVPPPFVLARWRRWYFSRMDRIISITRHNARVSAPALGLPLERFAVVPNAVDWDRYDSLRRRLGVAPRPETVLFFGRLAPRKGVPVLLGAIRRLRRNGHPCLRLRIVGEGPSLPHLHKLSNSMGLSAAVDFAGFKGGEDLMVEVLAASVVAIPSLYEGLPFTLLESMALGKAIVATSLPGIEENLKHGETGLLVPPGDEAALAGAIEALMADAPLRRRLGEAASQFVRHHRDWEPITRHTLQVYQEAALGQAEDSALRQAHHEAA